MATVTTYLPAQAAARRVTATEPSRSGIWVGIFAITMSFAAFTSALYVREGTGDFASLTIPPLMFANTIALLVSSFTMEKSRRQVAQDPQAHRGQFWLAATLLLGLSFIAGQCLVWRQLASQGIYLATSPNSSFFYVFTTMHVLHLLGGIAAVTYLLGRFVGGRFTVRPSLFGNVAIYWHFMGVLWLYLLLIIRTRL
jgi:cytochrome c oxidase subunit III